MIRRQRLDMNVVVLAEIYVRVWSLLLIKLVFNMKNTMTKRNILNELFSPSKNSKFSIEYFRNQKSTNFYISTPPNEHPNEHTQTWFVFLHSKKKTFFCYDFRFQFVLKVLTTKPEGYITKKFSDDFDSDINSTSTSSEPLECEIKVSLQPLRINIDYVRFSRIKQAYRLNLSVE